MKMALAIVLILLGGMALSWGLGFAALCQCVILTIYGAIFVVVEYLTVAYFLCRLGEWLKQKIGISPVIYVCCCFFIPCAFWLTAFAWVMYLDSKGRFEGFLAGLGEFLLSLSGLIGSGAMLALMLIYYGIKRLKNGGGEKTVLCSEDNNEP